MKKWVLVLSCVLLGSCGGGSDPINGVDVEDTSNSGLLDPNRPITGGAYGDPVYYPEGDIFRLQARDPNAYHLHEMNLETGYPFKTYEEVVAIRSELDDEVNRFLPLLYKQMQENHDFVMGGGVYDDAYQNEVAQRSANDFGMSYRKLDANGDLVFLEGVERATVSLMFKPTGGGEIFVGATQRDGYNDVTLVLGQSYDQRPYPKGYSVRYLYRKTTNVENRPVSEMWYGKLGYELPIVGNFVMLDYDSSDGSLFWANDYAMTESMIVAIRQMRTGVIE